MTGGGRCALLTMLSAATLVLGAAPVGAQWRVDAQAGRLQYDAAPDAVTTSLAIGLSRSSTSSSFGLSAGIPFTGEEPVWGALQGYRRLATRGPVRAGVDLGADGFAYYLSVPDSARLFSIVDEERGITGWGIAAEIMPLVAWDARFVSTEVRAGVVGLASSATDIEPYDRTAFVTDASASSPAWRGVSARVEGRWVSVSEGGFPYAGLSLIWDGPAAVWGSIGQWFDDAAESVTWEAGASVPLGRRVSMLLSGHHEEIDPVYATPARTTWGIGVSVVLGRVVQAVAEPVPAAYAAGVATIQLMTDEVTGTPSIAGDFNAWTPQPMVRDDARDAWVARLPLSPGVYNYAFVDGEGNWFVPEETPGRRSDGMGGYVAVLVVEE